MNSRLEDPKRDVQFSEGKLLTVCGGEATLEVTDDVTYMVIGVTAVFWQGALRDPASEAFKTVGAASEARQALTVNVLYGDFEGGQRVISQFAVRWENQRWLTSSGRHFQLDRPDPR